MRRLILTLVPAVLLATVVVACGSSSSGTSSATPTPPPTETATPSPTAPPEATATPAPTATSTETSAPGGPSAGEVTKLFDRNCARCHGPSGSGGSAPSINNEDNVARVKAQIEEGGDGMPAFSSRLTPGQIDALAQYVASRL